MIHATVYTIAAILALTYVGNLVARALFKVTGFEAASSPEPQQRAGRVIGILERLIVAAAIIAQSWELLAAVVALKTVARFQELDQRKFAEYFLVGSLFSILWSVSITASWSAYDRHFGINLSEKIEVALGLPSSSAEANAISQVN